MDQGQFGQFGIHKIEVFILNLKAIKIIAYKNGDSERAWLVKHSKH